MVGMVRCLMENLKTFFEKKLEEDFDKLVKAFSKVAKKNN